MRLTVLLLLTLIPVCLPMTARCEPIRLSTVLPTDPDWLVDGALDFRFRDASTGGSGKAYLQNAEIDLQRAITFRKLREGTVFLQVIDENPPDSASGQSGFRLGEAYATYRLPILTETDSAAFVKVGQFPIPFGLLPVYDTHLQILQSLYPESIGERLDWGVGVDGRFYGVLDYRIAVTAGSGPNNVDLNSNRVIAFRLGRLFATPVGTFNFGGSLLSGRLPNTQVDPITGFAPSLPPSGRVISSAGFVDKTRIAGDGQWSYLRYTMRGEAVAGADGDKRVYGYFLEGDYRFATGLTGIISQSYWDYGAGNSSSADLAAGINVSYGNNLVFRTLVEERRDIAAFSGPPDTTDHRRHLLTIQVLTRF